MHPLSRGPAAAPSLSLHAAFQRHLGIADAPSVEAPPLPPASSRAGQAAAAVPTGEHVDASAIQTFQASKGLPPRPDSISARLAELEAEAERTAVTRTAHGAYFGASSASARDLSHRSRPENLSVTAPFALATAPQTDASSLFDPAPHYRDKVALGGHAGGQKQAMRGNALRANLDPSRIDAESPAGTAAAPAALAGVPLSFFGVSTDLTRGQSRIQQRWLTNLGVSDVAPRKDGPLSPRKPMGEAAAKRASRPSSAVGAGASSSTAAEPEQQPQPLGAVFIPPLHIPVHPWQPSMQASKPDAMHQHAVLPPQHFEIPLRPDHVPHHLHHSAANQPAPPAPSAVSAYRPSSGRSSRPGSSTSRSQRTQQQVSAAAAAASAGAGSSRPASAASVSASLGASKSRPGTANKKALSSRPITDARIDSDTQATFIPGAADVSAFSLNIQGSNASLTEPVASHLVQRPSTVDAQRAASQQPQQQQQPSNQSGSYVADENEDGDDAIPFEQEYARFLAREQASALRVAGAQTSRPASSASTRPAPSTARPASGRGSGGTAIRSRPASGASTARRQQQEPLISSFTTRQAAATAASLSLYSGGPSALVRVSDRGLTNDVHFADRQNGLLLTTRARPPFMIGSRNDGHSAVPLHSAALKPNAGFQTELGVSAQLLGDFIAQAQAELPHFYSRHLFWDYRLTEMLRATEPDIVSEVAGNTMAGSGIRSNTIAAAGGGGGGEGTASRPKTVDSSSDHVYPSTYRIMAASYILQQVVPMLHTPHPETQTNTKSQEAANAAAQAPSTRALLRTALDVLHRSIYQPAPAVASTAARSGPTPNELARQMAALAPHEDLTADQLWTGTQGEAPHMSRRAKQIAAVQSSGYGQSSHSLDGHSELRDDLRQADRGAQRAFEHAISSEGQSSLLHAQARSLSSGVSTPLTSAAPLSSAAASAAPSYPIPYFLAVRYLYEGTQSFLLGSEKLSAKLARVDGSIDRIFARSARRLVTLAFKAWQGRVRTHRQKLNLAGFLTRKSRTQSAKRNPHLIFAMWKSFAARQALKRRYRKELGSMNSEIKAISTRLSRSHTADREQLLERMSAIQSSFVALEAGGKFRNTPVDVFSPLTLHLVLERYAEQIEMVEALAAACVDLLPLASEFSKARAVAVEVDMIVDELGSLSSSAQLANLSEIRGHLTAKLESLGRAEAAQENSMMESLIYLSAEDFLFRWVNCHLAESRAGRTLEDLAQLISGASSGAGGIYLELLKSVAPAVVDAVGKDLRGTATVGLGGSAAPASSSAATTAAFETRTIGHARWVLGVAAELGCTPVISMEEFLAHPNHAGVLARWKAQQDAWALHCGATAADGSASGAQSQAAAPFDPSGLSMHSAHPADAGLTPAELGLAVDEQGVPLHARRHMFDELGAELLEQQAEKQKKKQQQAGGPGAAGGKAPSIQQLLADSKFAAPRVHLDSVTPANPHLHLCLLASLFLQRPSLPPTASAASTSFVHGSKWLDSTRARLGQMQAQWEALKQRHDVSMRDIEAYLAQLQHVGLEIDVALRRGQRRSRSFAAIKAKMEELLWQLQKRKQTTSSASGSDSSAAGTTVVDGMVQSDLKRANLRLQALSYNEIPLGKLMDVLQPASASARADQALRDYGEIRHLLGKHYAELANIFRHYASLGFDDGMTAAGAGTEPSATSPTAAKKNPASLSAASTAGAALSFAEFVVLCQDCHLLSKKVNKGVLHTLFTRCTLTLKQLAAQSNHTMPHTDADRLEHSPLGGEELLANAAAAAKGSGIANKAALTSSSTSGDSASFSAGGSSLHLTLSQPALFESFIRLGILKYSTVTSLSERVRRLIEMDILPHACRLRLDEFRSLLNRDRVRHVFQAHKQELQIVFQHFAKEDAVVPKDGTVQSAAAKAAAIAAAAKGRVINKAGFLRLAQEAKLLSSPGAPASSHNPAHGLPFFESHLSAILSSVLRVPDLLLSAQASAAAGTGLGAGGSGSSVDFDLSFPEFLESLGSIAAFKFPDPYLPLQVKLENFLAHVLLPPLRRCSRRLNQIMSANNNAAASSGTAATGQPTHGLSTDSTTARPRRLA